MADKRVRRGAEAWRSLLDEQAASGLSAARFCALKELSAASFYQWRSRLAVRAAARPSPEGGAFVDLGALGGGGRFELRIDLGQGMTLQLARG